MTFHCLPYPTVHAALLLLLLLQRCQRGSCAQIATTSTYVQQIQAHSQPVRVCVCK